MANGGDYSADICGVCQSRKKIDGTCTNKCQEFLDVDRVPPVSISLSDDPKGLAEEARNNEVSKSLPEQPTVSVEESREKYPSVDCSAGKRQSKMVTASSLSIRVSVQIPAPRGTGNIPTSTANKVQHQSSGSPVQAASQPSGSEISHRPQLTGRNRGPRWHPAISQVQSAAAIGTAQTKKKRGPGGVVILYLTLQMCVRDTDLTDLSLDGHNKVAFCRLFHINGFKHCVIRNNKFFFYDVSNRNHLQIREVIDIFKLQIKDICFRMFKGEIINGKDVDTDNDIVGIFELIGFHVTASQVTGKIPKMLWRCEF